MFDSKPAASSAQIVVNIASLPSTVIVLGGALRVRCRGAGPGVCAGGGGACVCTCAGTGAGACPAAGNDIAAHNPISTIRRSSFCMPFAAVLTRAGSCFCLYLPRFSAWKGVSGSGPCPLATLPHLANLQAPNALRQGIPLLFRVPPRLRALRQRCSWLWNSAVRPVQRLHVARASANSEDAS